MANQPPTSRPFIRLPYFGRQPAAQPPPPRPAPVAQPPRPPIVRGGFAQALRPNPPQPQPPAPRQPPPPPPQLRTATPSPPPPPQLRSATSSPPPPQTPKRSPVGSPMPSPMASPNPSPTTTKNINLPTPRESPKSAQRSAQSSPSPVMATRSPSPISLPPSQLQSSKGEVERRILAEADQKTVVDKQVIYATPKTSPVKGFGSTYKEDNDQNKQSLLSNPKDDNVVTMAGENKGAIMDLGRDGKFPHNVSDDSEEESDDDIGRGRSRRLPRNAYVNSNVQGVNDSILYNCSISHHDPGVHFSLSRNGYSKSNGNGYGIRYHGNGKRH